MFLKLSIFFLLVCLIIDPTGEFYYLKYLGLISAFFICGSHVLTKGSSITINTPQKIVYITFAIIMPVYGTIITLFTPGVTKFNDTSYLGFASFLLLLMPVIFVQADIVFKSLINVLRLLSITTVVILISFILDNDSLGIAQFFIDKQSMLVGHREYGGIQTYFLYFTAAPLLIILVAYDSYRLFRDVTLYNALLCFLSISAIFLTGTRFNMIMAVTILPTIIAVYKFSVDKLGLYLLLFLCFIFLLFNSTFFSSFFNSTEHSNSVKMGYFETYYDLFKQPEVLFFGQGFSAYDTSIPFKAMLEMFGNEGVKTELTSIELLRVFGLFFGSFFNFIIILIPVLLIKKYKKLNFLIIGITFYLFSSLLNPYIFSTNGVALFLLILTLLGSNENISILKSGNYD